ncbi:hypothetical protein ES708_32984 [subsurface metagenome]
MLAPDIRMRYQEGTKRKKMWEEQYNRVFKGSEVESLEFSDLSNYNRPVNVNARVKVSQFGRVEGDNMMFKATFFPVGRIKHFAQTETRHNDLLLFFPSRVASKITYTIPDDYEIKNLPEDVDMENEYASYKFTARAKNKHQIEVNIALEVKATRVPKEDYSKFREFCTEIKKVEKEECELSRME